MLTNESTGAANEVWSFGDKDYDIIKGILFLRQRLLPYINQQMQMAHEKGTPPMRPLFFDFPEDEACSSVDDEFMFGPDIMVAPVLDYKARNRTIYLPSGTTWTDAWTGKKIKGGQQFEAEAPLERIPVYLRGNSRLPIKPIE
jgi:alpha-D-xyloside xylohydrolase